MMKTNRSRTVSVFALILMLAVTYGSLKADTGNCGGISITLPFTDVSGSMYFCEIAEAYFSGLMDVTTPTIRRESPRVSAVLTFSPSMVVTREQMAVYISQTLDSALNRGSRRAALNQWWTPTPHFDLGLATTTVGASPQFVASDGADVWSANWGSSSVSRVRASDGKLLETWTGTSAAVGILSAMGRIFVTGTTTPGTLYMIDPSQPPGAATAVASNLGGRTAGIAFDGNRIWTANSGGSVSIVTPGASTPWSVTTVSAGFSGPFGIVYDGTNIWVADRDAGTLLKLDSSGAILQTVSVGGDPTSPVFDGTNIWVPNFTLNYVKVVRAATGEVVTTLTGNGLGASHSAAFDGQRILIAGYSNGNVSLWKAAALTPLGSYSTGAGSAPFGACSDGVNFWIALQNTGKLARF